MDYNNLSTEELEKNFNPRESVENFNHYLENSLLKSKDVKKQTHIYENIAYGKGPLQKLDFVDIKYFFVDVCYLFICLYNRWNGVRWY